MLVPPPGSELVLPPGVQHPRFSPLNQVAGHPPDPSSELLDEEKLDRLDCASVQSEPVRPPPVELQPKRDSFSDSGAEGSGHNTPTRGRTFTEGLLRFVQDSSLQKPGPERRVSTVDQPGGGQHSNVESTPLPLNPASVMPQAAHVPVIQHSQQQFSTINQGQFSGVIQHSHIPDASYPRDFVGSMSSQVGQMYPTGLGSQPSAVYPSSATVLDQRYHSYVPASSQSLHMLGSGQVRPTKSASPPVRQEVRPPPNLQSHVVGGETHSLRQPIMSSIAQPSMAYSSVTGLVPMMMMPSASQGVYLAPRYQTPPPLGTLPGTPASPPGAVDHRIGNGGLLNGAHQALPHNHPALMNLSAAGGGLIPHPSAYRHIPGYSNHHPLNLAAQGMVLPEPGHMHDPSLVNPMPGVLNHGPALNHNTSMLGSNPTAGMINPASSLHAGQPGLMNQQQAGVISPASLAGLAINHHGALPAGASYPGLPGGIPINQQQQVRVAM